MENTPLRWDREHGSPALMGPAVSPRRGSGFPASLGPRELLPPLVRPQRQARLPDPEPLPWLTPERAGEPGTAAAEEAGLPPLELASAPVDSVEEVEEEPTSAAEEELFWLDQVEPSPPPEPDDLGLVRGADWGLSAAADDPDFDVEVTDLLWEEVREVDPAAAPDPWETAADPVEEGAEAPPPEPPAETAATEALDEWSLASAAGDLVPDADFDSPSEAAAGPPALPEVEPAVAPVQHLESALADAMRTDQGPAMEEVAGRLERIARALREGRPVELFASGSSDPLEVLIAGYALGYSEAFRRVNEERRGGR